MAGEVPSDVEWRLMTMLVTLTSVWTCPACGEDFIVDRESTYDECPWCNAIVRLGANSLEVVDRPGDVRSASEHVPCEPIPFWNDGYGDLATDEAPDVESAMETEPGP